MVESEREKRVKKEKKKRHPNVIPRLTKNSNASRYNVFA